MRTDVKIGIVVGLLVIAAIVVYFSVIGDGTSDKPAGDQVADRGDGADSGVKTPKLSGTGEPPTTPGTAAPPTPPSTPAATDTPGGTLMPEITPTLPGGVGAAPSGPPEPTGPAEPATPAEPTEPATPPTDGGVVEIAAPPEDAPPGPEVAETPSPGRPIFEPLTASRRPADAAEPPAVDILGPSEVAGPAAPAAPAPPVPTDASTHKVKEGDGLWTIAEEKYGRGKGYLWTHIAKANPNVDPNNLRIGSTLVIPPAPASGAGTSEAAGAASLIAGAGEKIHTIRQDDGLWKLAYKYYGDGRLWTHIAKANPKINPLALPVGRDIIIPAKPSASAATPGVGSAAAPSEPAADLAPGYRRYVVRSGDTLSAVSNRQYGSTRYWPAIAKANPNVNPHNLKVGSKLVIPPISEAKEVVTPPRRGGGASAAPSGAMPAGRPDFGP